MRPSAVTEDEMPESVRAAMFGKDARIVRDEGEPASEQGDNEVVFEGDHSEGKG